MRKVRLLFFTVGIFFSLASFSQSVSPAILNTTGGFLTYTYYRFEWSFGEATAVETMTSGSTSNIVITNGVLQPGTNTPATVNTNTAWGPEEIKIYPNPTRDWITIDFFSTQKGNITLNVYDESGVLQLRKQFVYNGFSIGLTQRMNLSSLASGTYFLNIQMEPTGTSVRKYGTFKIQKLN